MNEYTHMVSARVADNLPTLQQCYNYVCIVYEVSQIVNHLFDLLSMRS